MECSKCKAKLVVPAGKSSPAPHECEKKKPKKKAKKPDAVEVADEVETGLE